mmetsp:Transcript_23274/g.54162  ORF Transcript_23274/g.54162 Transcript_23274/m.54162 type:complete len:265 (-) Transcript_23274:48-842(-)|eukprot:CAMPEP_0178443284 /NCGR_PEP_ID=MMETSP0689_2-20121128/38786_1 /TAXON_ID=160604 /ORGANISM="Amphidinium massartii, Strain CS-259" /LENGTH=264 /DNA_ID=CAMNT_0020067227 /DNA_START=60 /DNA_END=854 /DNA_ORIENTATION=+
MKIRGGLLVQVLLCFAPSASAVLVEQRGLRVQARRADVHHVALRQDPQDQRVVDPVCPTPRCPTMCSLQEFVNKTTALNPGGEQEACFSSCQRLSDVCCSFCLAHSYPADLETSRTPTTEDCLASCPTAVLAALTKHPPQPSSPKAAVRSKFTVPDDSATAVGSGPQQANSTVALARDAAGAVATDAVKSCKTWCKDSKAASRPAGNTSSGSSCWESCREMFMECDTSCMVAFSDYDSDLGPSTSRESCMTDCSSGIQKHLLAL